MLKIEKLCQDNFHSWKQKVMHILSFRELDALIDAICLPPADDPDAKAIWLRNYRKEMAVIALSLSNGHLSHVEVVSCISEMWRSILNIFERHTLLNRLTTRSKFYTVTMHENETILTFTKRVQKLATYLISMGVPIDDEETAMVILNGLPARFDHIISALDALGNDNRCLSLEFIKSRLLQKSNDNS